MAAAAAGGGRVILLVGAKGGAGTTAVAAGMAAACARDAATVLLPLPGHAGDELALWFAGTAEGQPAMTPLRDQLGALTPELLEGAAWPAGPRLSLLRPDAGAWAGPDTARLLSLAATRWARVVVDGGAWQGGPLDPGLEAAARSAAIVAIVFAPDPPSLRRTRALATALRPIARSVVAIANRIPRDGRGAPDTRGWGEALDGLGVAAACPETAEVPEAQMRGAPPVAEGARSGFAAELGRVGALLAAEGAQPGNPEEPASAEAFRTPAFRSLKRRLHARFLERLRARGEAAGGNGDGVHGELAALVEAEAPPDLTPGFRDRLLKELADSVLGLGPLQDLLDDPAVTEIMVNGPEMIFVERAGKLSRLDRSLDGEEELRGLIERIVAPLGRRIDESSPLVDARLADGSRVNAIIPPLALNGSTLTIRKFARRRLTAEDLVAGGSLTPAAAAFLRTAVAGRLNVLISGGTGSGKTTLLNIMASFIPPGERIVTIEDAAELQLPQDHVVRLESRPANLEGRGAVPIRDLVRNALRMRPDRIVVGECRGGEALDMLQAMNTGHDGSLSTLHANTPRDALSRLETLVLMAGMDLPLRAVREQVASAVDLIVQIARLKDGSRRITAVTEVCGMEGEVFRLQDIFTRRGEGDLLPAGLPPRCAERLADRGHTVDPAMFR